MSQVDIEEKYIQLGRDGVYNNLQLLAILKGVSLDVDVTLYDNRKFSANQMEEILKGLRLGIDVTIYAKMEFNAGQMYEILKGLSEGINVTAYANPQYKRLEMKQMRRKIIKDKGLMYKE